MHLATAQDEVRGCIDHSFCQPATRYDQRDIPCSLPSQESWLALGTTSSYLVGWTPGLPKRAKFELGKRTISDEKSGAGEP